MDWHGVLSRGPFWMSIRQSATHPLKAQLEANFAEVLSNTANEWMKGLLSASRHDGMPAVGSVREWSRERFT